MLPIFPITQRDRNQKLAQSVTSHYHNRIKAQEYEMLKLIEITSQAIKNHSESNIKLQIHQALDEDIRKIEELNKEKIP